MTHYPRGIEVIVGAYIINDKNQVLLFQSPKWGNEWTICGGHVEVGETIDAAVKREVKEEIFSKLKASSTSNHCARVNSRLSKRSEPETIFTTESM